MMKRRLSLAADTVLALCAVYALSVKVRVFPIKEVLKLTGGQTDPALLFLARLRLGVNSGSPVLFLLFLIALWFFRTQLCSSSRPFLSSAALVSLCLTAWTLLGISFAAYQDWRFLFGNHFQVFQSGILFLGYWAIYYSATAALYRRLDTGIPPPEVRGRYRKRELRRDSWFQRHFLLTSFLCILLARIPHLWAFFPGTINTDSHLQLQMFYGMRPFTNHWPYVSTLIQGLCFHLGRLLLPESMAIFAYILFQTVLTALCFAYVCSTVKRLTGSGLAAAASLLFFALVPCWGAYAACMIKDTLYAGLFAWFGAEFCRTVADRASMGWRQTVRLFLSGGAAMLFRNDLVYIALPALLVLLLVQRRGWCRYAAAALGGILFLYAGLYYALAPALGIQSGSSREMLSIPFQQVARYCVKHGDTLSEREVAVIDSVLDYDVLVKRYNPEVSDNVKNTYRDECTSAQRAAFFRLWRQMFLQHPGTMIQATFSNSFGYWYPGYFSGRHCYNTTYLTKAIQTDPAFRFRLYSSKQVQSFFHNLYYCCNNLPVLSQLESPGTGSWVMVLVAGAALRKKKGGLLAACVISLMAFAVCVASPVNGALRYALPQLAFLPALLALAAHELQIWREPRTGTERPT